MTFIGEAVALNTVFSTNMQQTLLADNFEGSWSGRIENRQRHVEEKGNCTSWSKWNVTRSSKTRKPTHIYTHTCTGRCPGWRDKWMRFIGCARFTGHSSGGSSSSSRHTYKLKCKPNGFPWRERQRWRAAAAGWHKRAISSRVKLKVALRAAKTTRRQSDNSVWTAKCAISLS